MPYRYSLVLELEDADEKRFFSTDYTFTSEDTVSDQALRASLSLFLLDYLQQIQYQSLRQWLDNNNWNLAYETQSIVWLPP